MNKLSGNVSKINTKRSNLVGTHKQNYMESHGMGTKRSMQNSTFMKTNSKISNGVIESIEENYHNYAKYSNLE